MRKLLLSALAMTCMTGYGWASTCLPAPCPSPCPPVEKWVEVCETVTVEVPVTEYVDEPCEVTVTTMTPVEEEVEVCEGRWVEEMTPVTVMKTVRECETYVVNEARYETRSETRMRTVRKKVCETVMKTVYDTVCEAGCDPCTGQTTRKRVKVARQVPTTVTKTVCVQEPYTVNVKCKIMVPVTKTRQVCRQVPETQQQCTRRWVTETVKKKVTVMRPVEEKRTVMNKRAVCTTKMVEKQVVRRVKVPVEPGC
ncbi:MAG: hypothetical protein LUC93_07445 [Planctomycetaceae bacterium]|nr:hypothetical protein [Planctomycetaceae bacterium]